MSESVTDGVEAITVMQSVEIGRTELVFGEVPEPTTLQRPELVNGAAVEVKRLYEPIGTVHFDAPRSQREVQEWLADEPQRGPLAEHTFESEQRTDLINRIITQRQRVQETVTSTHEQIVAAQAAEDTDDIFEILDELDSALEEVQETFQPLVVDGVPDSVRDGGDDE